MEELLNSSRRLGLLKLRLHFSAVTQQGWLAGSLPAGTSPDSLPCSHLLRLKPMIAISPRPPFLANHRCRSVPSAASEEE